MFGLRVKKEEQEQEQKHNKARERASTRREWKELPVCFGCLSSLEDLRPVTTAMSSEDDSSGKDAHGDGNCSGGRGLDDNGRISDLEFIGTSDSQRVDSDTTPGSRDASNPMKRGKLAAGENGVSMERPAASTALLHLSAASECNTRTCGIEHLVKQRSAEWFQIRRRCVLGASQFGDAVGAGRGRPIHFLQSLRQQSFLRAPDATPATQHGIDSEPMIGEMYHLLSGNRPEQCGVFTPPPGDVMHNLIAATPGESPRFVCFLRFR